MSTRRYTVETLASGQPRPYADSVYHYRITVEWRANEHKDKNAPFVPNPELSEHIVKPILKGICGWRDDPGPFDRQLRKCEMVQPGVWEVIVIEPYTD